MNAGIAAYVILSQNTDVTDIVGVNIFPEVAEQETATPFIVYQLQSVAPEDTHDGPSKLDEVRFEFLCYADSYALAADLGDKVRGALDRVSGTYNGVNVESVQFNDVDIDTIDAPRRFAQVLTFTFRIKRDNFTIAQGTPVTGAKLGDLSDVDVAGVSDGQFIKYVAAQQKWQAADSAGSTTLAALTDVNLAGLGSKDVINYNSTTGKWEPVDFLNVLYTNLKTGVSTTINDGANTNSALELGATTAKLKTGISEILITETSPGDIDFIVATDGSGTTAYTALNIDGSTSANEAILNIPVGTQLHIKSPTHYAYLRYSGGANASLSLPTISGTIARTADIAIDSAVAANTAKISYTDASAVAANTAKNTYPSADATKLAGIETSADVTDATNVASAGALMAASAQLTGDLDTQANEIKTTTANGNIKINPNGTGSVEIMGDGSDTGTTGAIQLNCSNNQHGVTIQSPAHSAGATYTLTLPTSAGTNGQALTTNGSGVLSFSDVAAGTKYHDRFQSNAATFRSGATATVELYYTAKADGDGLAESASSDTPTAGKVIKRKIYYSESAFSDPDTGTWVEFTTLADDITFANAKAALLEYLKARTGGTVPISLKQTWEEVTAAPSYTGLLNESYGSGAAAAYSTRRLNGNVTDCMVIRRASDSTTTTIGFDSNGDIDESAITTFCTGTTCTVYQWLDQSGNGNNATAPSTGAEPTIYTGGAIVNNPSSSKTSLLWNNNERLINTSLAASGSMSAFTTARIATQYRDGVIDSYESTSRAHVRIDAVFSYFKDQGSASTAINTHYLLSSFQVSGTSKAGFVNGYSDLSNSNSDAAFDGLSIGSIAGNPNPLSTSFNFGGYIDEILIYNSNKSSVRTAIESNIGDYFTQNTPLLDTYTGAAAAYSLRKLRTAYTGNAVEVYNGSSYADIGFNVFGELDTVALAAHCGSSDGFVSKWYDQSGNTYTAAQTTTSKMPKIYDGTTGVLTENGKPSIDFDGTNDFMLSAAQFTNTDKTIEIVYTPQEPAGYFFGILNVTASPAVRARFYLQKGPGVVRFAEGNPSVINYVSSSQAQAIHYMDWTNSNSQMNFAVNGNTVSSATGNSNTPVGVKYMLGDINQGNDTPFSSARGKYQEIIIYDSNQSSNRTAIETNINNFYSIY